MNSDWNEGNGGVHIKPTARRSIHSHVNTRPNNTESMVRYGLNTQNSRNERDNLSNDDDEGTDVVDNVMSKPIRQLSPLSIRKKKIQRTNSYSQEEENTEYNINILSKSLPAYLPSHLSYSDDDSDLDLPNNSASSLTRSRIEDESQYSIIANKSNKSFQSHQGTPYTRKQSISSRHETPSQSQVKLLNIILIITVIIGVLAAILQTVLPNKIIFSSQDKSTQTVNHDKIIFENNLDNLQQKYKIDDNSILKLKTGLSTIFSRMDTGSFMFVYNSNSNNFNPVRFDKFIDEVAYTAARYLRNHVSAIQHTVVISSNLDMLEHGELITRYRDDVDRSGVMLVKEVDGVPSNLAMAFHYYCDEYEPLVKRSAIFFTLNRANCSNSSDQKTTHEFIEKCLAKKWTTVPAENMRPLLTRVVDIIIDVTSVF